MAAGKLRYVWYVWYDTSINPSSKARRRHSYRIIRIRTQQTEHIILCWDWHARPSLAMKRTMANISLLPAGQPHYDVLITRTVRGVYCTYARYVPSNQLQTREPAATRTALGSGPHSAHRSKLITYVPSTRYYQCIYAEKSVSYQQVMIYETYCSRCRGHRKHFVLETRVRGVCRVSCAAPAALDTKHDRQQYSSSSAPDSNSFM